MGNDCYIKEFVYSETYWLSVNRELEYNSGIITHAGLKNARLIGYSDQVFEKAIISIWLENIKV